MNNEKSRRFIIEDYPMKKNFAYYINKIHDAVSVFIFTLYFWICLDKKLRNNLKKGNSMRIVTPVCFLKETVVVDIHFSNRQV